MTRALSLIEHGALDEADVDALAGRLGVGERQLRRLFQQHLGASPVVVALTRRVLLAKQLIHETHLPMTEVAFAAGVGSIRRFNETFRQLFGRSPRELRRTTAPEFSTAAAAGELVLLLRYQPPYDRDATIAFLRQRAISGIEHVSARLYARTLQLDGLTGTVTVEPADGNALRATVRFSKLSALPAIIARLRRVFDLGADPLAIAAHLAKDPTLAPLVKARPGLRVPGAWDGFELAIRAVLGQQINRGCGCAARRPDGGGLWRAAVIAGRTSDACLSAAAGHRRRRSRFARHAEKPGRRAVGGRSRGRRGSACV